MDGQILTAPPSPQEEIQVNNSNGQKKAKLKAIALVKVGLFELLFAIVGLLIIFGVLNYFNLLPISQSFPFLSFLPSQQKIEQDKTQTKTQTVAAVVNGEEIPMSDYKKLLSSQEYFYTKIYPAQSKQEVSDKFLKGLSSLILDNLIRDALLSQYLAKKNVVIKNDDVKQYIQKNIVNQDFAGDWKAYEKSLKTNGGNLETAFKNIKSSLLKEKVQELENLRPLDFDRWYLDLKNISKITKYAGL